MAQVSMTVRMDSQLKQNFDALCQQFGMSANTAMNIFANAVVMYRKIPFEIKAEDKQERTPKNQPKEYPLEPYTMEELYSRVAESSSQKATTSPARSCSASLTKNSISLKSKRHDSKMVS